MYGQTGSLVNKISDPFYWLMRYKWELICVQGKRSPYSSTCVPPFSSFYSPKTFSMLFRATYALLFLSTIITLKFPSYDVTPSEDQLY